MSLPVPANDFLTLLRLNALISSLGRGGAGLLVLIGGEGKVGILLSLDSSTPLSAF